MKPTSKEFDKILFEPLPTGTVFGISKILDVYQEMIFQAFMIPAELLEDKEFEWIKNDES